VDDEVPGEAVHAVDGENARESVHVHVGPAILEQVDDDLSPGTGDGPEVSQEGLAERGALKRVSSKKIHRNIVEPLTARRGVFERVADLNVQVGEGEIEMSSGELHESGIDVHADNSNTRAAPGQQVREGACAEAEEQGGARQAVGQHGGPIPEGGFSVRYGDGQDRAILNQDPVTFVFLDGQVACAVAVHSRFFRVRISTASRIERSARRQAPVLLGAPLDERHLIRFCRETVSALLTRRVAFGLTRRRAALENTPKGPDHLLPDVRETLNTFSCRFFGANIDFANYAVTGQDPIAAIRGLARWINYVHAKDARKIAEGWQFTYLGNGTLPLKDILGALDATGKRFPLCFEFPGEGDPEGCIRNSLEFLGRRAD
jgi:hypothetical protein